MHTGKLDRFHLSSTSYHTSSRNEGGDRDAAHTYIYWFPLRLRLFVGCDCGPGVAGQTPFRSCVSSQDVCTYHSGPENLGEDLQLGVPGPSVPPAKQPSDQQ
jgi:hypothetical protein